MLHGHGDDSYLYHQPIKADFSSNVNYNGPGTDLKKHLAEELYRISNYPEAAAESLRQAVALSHGIETEQIIITNGATEAFYLIAHTYRNTNATIAVPAFQEYEDTCVINNIPLQFIGYNELNEECLFTSKLVFIGNPNNPTGQALKIEVLKKIIHHNPASIFIIDEAYIDFTNYTTSLAVHINEFDNLVIVKSLTKAYAIPGLRLGYIISNKNIIGNMLISKMPWSVNSLAISAGKYIIQQKKSIAQLLPAILHDAQNLIKQLNNITSIKVYPTYTHFFLCEAKTGTAAGLKIFLIENHKLLIRDAGNFRGLTPQHFRIATQSPEHNNLLIAGIKAWIAQC